MAQGDKKLIPRENQTNDIDFIGYETGALGEVQEGVVLAPYGYTREEHRQVTVTDVAGGVLVAAASANRILLRITNAFGNSKIIKYQSKGDGGGTAIPALTWANGSSLWGREQHLDRDTQSEYRAICNTGETETLEVWEVFLKG